MYSEYPVKFSGEVLPRAIEWEESSACVENIHHTESGIDQISLIRYDKRTIKCVYQVSDRWASKFKKFAKKDYIIVDYYDLDTLSYQPRSMRIRNLKMKLMNDTEDIINTNGLWLVTFNLEEF